jgi:hypothetical protein
MQVTRHVWDAAAGKSVQQSEVLEVPIKRGWKAGTKVTYAGTSCPVRGSACLAVGLNIGKSGWRKLSSISSGQAGITTSPMCRRAPAAKSKHSHEPYTTTCR